jgi:hypothetical protein
MIAKADLVHGAYYEGHCRNANVARWDARSAHFRHWRTKFASTFLEYIRHPDDEACFDVFTPTVRLDGEQFEIPLEDGDG